MIFCYELVCHTTDDNLSKESACIEMFVIDKDINTAIK